MALSLSLFPLGYAYRDLAFYFTACVFCYAYIDLFCPYNSPLGDYNTVLLRVLVSHQLPLFADKVVGHNPLLLGLPLYAACLEPQSN